MYDPPRLRSWCARETGAVARPISKAEYLPFAKNSLKLVMCAVASIGLQGIHDSWAIPLPAPAPLDAVIKSTFQPQTRGQMVSELFRCNLGQRVPAPHSVSLSLLTKSTALLSAWLTAAASSSPSTATLDAAASANSLSGWPWLRA